MSQQPLLMVHAGTRVSIPTVDGAVHPPNMLVIALVMLSLFLLLRRELIKYLLQGCLGHRVAFQLQRGLGRLEGTKDG